MEFDTFVRHRIPVIALVGNDASAWAQIARDQIAVLGDDVGTVLASTDYELAAEALGGKGLAIGHPDEIAPAFAQARVWARAGHPVLLNARLTSSEFRKGWNLALRSALLVGARRRRHPALQQHPGRESRDHDRAAEEGGRARPLAGGEPCPQRVEHRLEQHEQRPRAPAGASGLSKTASRPARFAPHRGKESRRHLRSARSRPAGRAAG